MPNTNTNFDKNELAKFEALAYRWWDTESEFKSLHDINPLRLNFIDEHAGLKGKKVLDIGCGGGVLAESMVHQGAEVMGIDLGDAPLTVAKLHAKEQNLDVDYQAISAEDLADQQPASFDVVTCMEMLEHVPDPAAIVEACSELVKPDGHVFFSTINRNPKSFLFAIVGAEYILNLLPKGTHEFEKLIRPSELDHWIRRFSMYTNEIVGMNYNPLNKSYNLSADISVNYLIHAKK
ncbi:MAG: bifunctional 2-polyprenyl-6-hydroxyphenol methylase/3-demethylubiquinol 3-O-methyltransferase UbiG [Gammaproteobacteria bacterium]|nr:bifunctional 2-polyprenyl-6-hydroxyphenol methylase/3-demethylubiquinol 3-O-methyltransferase UbiG [Gammaproteobacteria bacterium]